MAEQLRKNPTLYDSLKDIRTPLGVQLATCIKTGVDNKGHKMIKMVGLVAGDEHCYDVFKELFEPTQLPSVVVFNPHKRLRFATLEHGEEGEVKGDESGISSLVDKVLGGDARFKQVKGQKLPAWATRDPKAAKPGKKEL